MEILKIQNLSKIYGAGERRSGRWMTCLFGGKRGVCGHHRAFWLRKVHLLHILAVWTVPPAARSMWTAPISTRWTDRWRYSAAGR